MANSENGYEFKVNGEQFAADQPKVSALEILTIAKQGNAIPNNPEEYTLKGEKAEYRGDDIVDLDRRQRVHHGPDREHTNILRRSSSDVGRNSPNPSGAV